jgi:hypothetical protein
MSMIEPPMLYKEKMLHCGISISTKWVIFLLIVLWIFFNCYYFYKSMFWFCLQTIGSLLSTYSKLAFAYIPLVSLFSLNYFHLLCNGKPFLECSDMRVANNGDNESQFFVFSNIFSYILKMHNIIFELKILQWYWLWDN